MVKGQLDAAKDLLETAQDESARLIVRQAEWDGDVSSTLLTHEEGHRTICYIHADEMTTLLNTMRAYGYAVNTARASQLGREHCRKLLTEKLAEIIARKDLEQERYDRVTGHGKNQDKWSW